MPARGKTASEKSVLDSILRETKRQGDVTANYHDTASKSYVGGGRVVVAAYKVVAADHPYVDGLLAGGDALGVRGTVLFSAMEEAIMGVDFRNETLAFAAQRARRAETLLYKSPLQTVGRRNNTFHHRIWLRYYSTLTVKRQLQLEQAADRDYPVRVGKFSIHGDGDEFDEMFFTAPIQTGERSLRSQRNCS